MGFFLKSDNEAIDKAQLHFRTKFQQESVGGGLLQKLYERKLQKNRREEITQRRNSNAHLMMTNGIYFLALL